MCVVLAQLSLYSFIWDASVGLIIHVGLGAPNRVKFDITNPDKIAKMSYSLRQEFQCIRIHLYICIFSSY